MDSNPVGRDPPSRPAAQSGEAVDLFIARHPPRIQQLLEVTRDFLHGTAPGLREGIKWGVPTFMMATNLFYIKPKEDHVILGFANGAKMLEFRSVFDKVLTEVGQVIVRHPQDLMRRDLRAAVRSEAGLPSADVQITEYESLQTETLGDA